MNRQDELLGSGRKQAQRFGKLFRVVEVHHGSESVGNAHRRHLHDAKPSGASRQRRGEKQQRLRSGDGSLCNCEEACAKRKEQPGRYGAQWSQGAEVTG